MPAYTFRATGASDNNTGAAPLAPGAPAGKAVGDLLRLISAARITGLTHTDLSATWTKVAGQNTNSGSTAEWLRIADGTSNDTPTVDWTTTDDQFAWIEAYFGDVYTPLSTIVAEGPVYENDSISQPIAPALTIATANTMVMLFTQKRKTATSNDATTLTVPTAGSFVKRGQIIISGTAVASGTASWQQTTATNFDGTDWTIDGTTESLSSVGHIYTLKTLVAAPLAPIRLIWRM